MADFIISNGVLKKYTGTNTIVNIPEGVKIIDEEAFIDSKITKVSFPKSLRIIENSAFAGCSLAGCLEIPAHVEYIGHYAFQDCKGINEIILHHGIKTIGMGAFSNLGDIKDVIIPNNVTLDSCVFNQTQIAVIYVGQGVRFSEYADSFFYEYDESEYETFVSPTTIVKCVKGCPFDKKYQEEVKYALSRNPKVKICRLEYVSSSEINAQLLKIDNNLSNIIQLNEKYPDFSFDTEVSIATLVNTKANTVTIPEFVEIIGEGSFENGSIESIIFPSRIKEIRDGAFKNCKKLKSVSFKGTSLIKIGKEAFSGTALTSFIVPKGTSVLEERVFSETKITSIVIPRSVVDIRGNMFGSIWMSNSQKIAVIGEPNTAAQKYAEKNFHTFVEYSDKIVRAIENIENTKKTIKKRRYIIFGEEIIVSNTLIKYNSIVEHYKVVNEKLYKLIISFFQKAASANSNIEENPEYFIALIDEAVSRLNSEGVFTNRNQILSANDYSVLGGVEIIGELVSSTANFIKAAYNYHLEELKEIGASLVSEMDSKVTGLGYGLITSSPLQMLAYSPDEMITVGNQRRAAADECKRKYAQAETVILGNAKTELLRILEDKVFPTLQVLISAYSEALKNAEISVLIDSGVIDSKIIDTFDLEKSLECVEQAKNRTGEAAITPLSLALKYYPCNKLAYSMAYQKSVMTKGMLDLMRFIGLSDSRYFVNCNSNETEEIIDDYLFDDETEEAENAAQYLSSSDEETSDNESQITASTTAVPTPSPIYNNYVGVSVTADNIQSVYTRIELLLEDEDWQKADFYCESALNYNPKDAKIYLYKALADTRSISLEDMVSREKYDENNKNIIKMRKFADETFTNTIDDTIYEVRSSKIYSQAEKLIELKTIEDLQQAIELLKSIEKYRDSKQLIENCKNNIALIENEIKTQKYQQAVILMNSGEESQCEQALAMFRDLGSWKDSTELTEKCQITIDSIQKDRIYESAVSLMKLNDEKSVNEAEKLFESILEWKDSKEKALQCSELAKTIKIANIIREADKLMLSRTEDSVNRAISVLSDIRNESGIEKRILECSGLLEEIETESKYNHAKELMGSNVISEQSEAKTLFLSISAYKDAKELAALCEEKLEEIEIKEKRYAELKNIADSLSAEAKAKELDIENCPEKTEEQRLSRVIEESKDSLSRLGLFKGKEKKRLEAEIEQYSQQLSVIQGILAKKANEFEEIKKKVFDAQRNIFKLKLFDNDNNVVLFGRYPQETSDKENKQDIEWIVLDKKYDKALLISKYALDSQAYNSTYTDITWDKCSLREWLNNTFIKNAFTSEEQALIQKTKVSADKNPEYSTSPGKDTEDKVFLLSITEAEKYFTKDERKCAPTAYAKAHGVWTSDSNKTASGEVTCLWWLRSPGDDQRRAACVSSGGSVTYYGGNVRSSIDGVRPALWINLDIYLFQ